MHIENDLKGYRCTTIHVYVLRTEEEAIHGGEDTLCVQWMVL